MTRRQDVLEDTPPVMGSGDFLADQGYSAPDESAVKFQLANKIALLVEDHDLSQADVCRMTSLRQADVSRIVNGNVEGYSVWRLMATLKGLGQKVVISVEEPSVEEDDAFAVAL